MNKHTEGEWKVGVTRTRIFAGAERILIADTIGKDKQPKVNAARIVACVNALDGIADPNIISELLEAVFQYHDDLKYPPTGDSLDRRLERVETLISKIKESE